MIDRFHIYMHKDKDPACKVGNIVCIDKIDVLDIEVIDYKDNYSVFPWNSTQGDLYGIVTEIVQRTDGDYYINGRLLNFSTEEKSPSLMGGVMGGYGNPYTSNDKRTLTYSERTSAMFRKISSKHSRELKSAFPDWFL